MTTDARYKDGTYLRHNQSWHAEDSPWKARQILKMLDRNDLRPHTICEVGCGVGEILFQLSTVLGDTEFYGYEISPQAFALAENRRTDRIHFYLKDALQEPMVYDVVMAIDVMEHVEDPFTFLRALHAKGRHQILHIPLDLSVQTVLRGSPLVAGRRQIGHLNYFTKETALAILEDTGLEVIDYFYTAGMAELSGKRLRSRLLNVPRRALFKISEDMTVRVLGGYSLLVLAR